MTSPTPYPLLFAPLLMPKVWGGRRLERFGKKLPPAENIGESWELADLAATSASGAGGGSARSAITNGALAGKTLHDAVDAWGHDLLGNASATKDGNFPLLVKYLDARENLSVQVHPSPAYAATHRDAHLKTECWYILDAEPGSVIYKGVKPGVTRTSFERGLTVTPGMRSAESRDSADLIPGVRSTSVIDDLVAVPAIPGECHNLPSGTVHALGAGVLVAEVQTPSDTTFRVYDWGRTGRELHIAQALECIDFGPAPGTTTLGPDEKSARLVTTEFFTLDEHRLDRLGTLHGARECRAIMVLDGSLSLGPGAGLGTVTRGQTALIPASWAGPLTAVSPTTLLVARPV